MGQRHRVNEERLRYLLNVSLNTVLNSMLNSVLNSMLNSICFRKYRS